MTSKFSKIGIPIFLYDHFRSKRSAPSVNLGDSIQTLAIKSMLASIGIGKEDLLLINRDALPNYNGEPVRFIMHGVFSGHCFPIPKILDPVFFGFNSDERTIFKHRHTLKRYSPIGCRDTHTTALARAHGISSYTSGCLTLSLPKHSADNEAKNKSLFIVTGEGEGAFPEEIYPNIPKHLACNAKHVHQRSPAKTYPLSPEAALENLVLAQSILDRYQREAKLIITPLLHAASPALAMGIPTIVVRREWSPRFSALSRLLPIQLTNDIHKLNWAPEVLDLSYLKALQRQALVDALFAGAALSPAQEELDRFWGNMSIDLALKKRMARIWSKIH